MLLRFVFLICFFAVINCSENTECENTEVGTLRNFTGLDGCGWIIQLQDSTNLEPLNLKDFDLELKEGKVIHFKYHERKDMASICMVGKIIGIDCLMQ